MKNREAFCRSPGLEPEWAPSECEEERPWMGAEAHEGGPNERARSARMKGKSWWASYESILCKDLDASLGGSIVIHHSSRWSG